VPGSSYVFLFVRPGPSHVSLAQFAIAFFRIWLRVRLARPETARRSSQRVFRSPGVGAVMFALLPTLWVFVPTLRDPKNPRILPQALEGAWDGPGPPDSAVRPLGMRNL